MSLRRVVCRFPGTGVHPLLLACAAGVALSTVAGCGSGPDGPPREPITGSVTREGMPVDSGVITFTSSTGPAAQAAIIDGRYEFDVETGPVAGNLEVRITQNPRRAEVPEGTPKKDADVIKEDRFKGQQPPGGWTFQKEVKAGQSDPIDFAIE